MDVDLWMREMRRGWRKAGGSRSSLQRSLKAVTWVARSSMETRLTGHGEPNWRFGGKDFFPGQTGSSYTITHSGPIATVGS